MTSAKPPYTRALLPAAVDMIKKFEKCDLKPYQGGADKATTWTVGWGHKMGPEDGWMRAGLTQKQADDIFAKDLAKHSIHIQEDLGVGVLLNDFEYGALACFCYNLGPRGLLIAPSVYHPAREGKLTEGLLQLYKFNKGERGEYEDGLFYRRLVEIRFALEKELMNKPENCIDAKSFMHKLSTHGDVSTMASVFETHHQKEHCHVCQAKPPTRKSDPVPITKPTSKSTTQSNAAGKPAPKGGGNSKRK